MAVTIDLPVSYPDYMLDGSEVPGCIGGGTDYRTVANKGGTVEGALFARAWAGDNISNACKITKITIKSYETKVTDSNGFSTAYKLTLTPTVIAAYGSVSGNILTPTNVSTSSGQNIKLDSSSWTSHGSIQANVGNFQANRLYIGFKFKLKNDNTLWTLRGYFRNIKISATRTRACYITFQGDGVTTTTTTYDYGSTPSYGSTPTRTGYDFKGWKSSADNTVYTGTLPTAYEQDVTYTAQWQLKTYTATFLNYDGSTLQTKSVSHGNTPVYTGSTPTRDSTAEFDYCFNGWSPSLSAITSNTTYTAQYTATKRSYKISTEYNGQGSVSGSGTYEYGTNATLKATPNSGYKFVKWSDENTDNPRTITVTGDATYTAIFEADKINKIYVGISQLKSIYVGTSEVKAVYVGTTKVYG